MNYLTRCDYSKDTGVDYNCKSENYQKQKSGSTHSCAHLFIKISGLTVGTVEKRDRVTEVTNASSASAASVIC